MIEHRRARCKWQPRLTARASALALFCTIAGAAASACEGCHPQRGAQPDAADAPTVRLYLVSDPAGALEPCGCVKDQLGGLNHVAAWMKGERKRAPDSLFVSAGPLFFIDPVIEPPKKAQELAKAETLAASLKDLGLVSFSPGRNDWALGQDTFARLAGESGAAALAANATPASGVFHASVLREVHGVKVGIVGVAQPDKATEGMPTDGFTFAAPEEAAKAEAAKLKAQGAQVLVALAAVGRGEAKRIADAVPDFTVVVVGSTGGGGEENTPTPSPELDGKVIVAQTGNHLQTVGVLDLFVRDGSFDFHDATGLGRGQKRDDLTRRIDELRGKIADWEKSGKVDPKDLAARKADLARLESQKKALDEAPAPKAGSFFRYTSTEVRDSLGSDDAIQKQLLAYYKKVDDMNRVAFAGLKPPPAPPGGDSYAGVEACSTCHAAPRAVWDKTAHAHAYVTLSSQFKEFNLDCVSCHVTGYDRPGGSTVTHVEKLKDVQCEVCHGPSSRHAENPKIPPEVPKPTAQICTTCHHPPHVHTFDAQAKLQEILGPGHGKPLH